MPKTAMDLVNIMRNVTGRVDASDPLFTNQIMTQYLNDFIVQLSSQEVRLFKNMTWWEFDISPSTPNPMPVNLQELQLTTIGPPAYVILAAPSVPASSTEEAMDGAIDGSNTTYTLNATLYPLPGTFVITGSNPAQVLVDDGEGHFTGDGTGIINYNTGLVSVAFNTAPIAASTVTAAYDFNTAATLNPNTPSNSFQLFWMQDPQEFYLRWPLGQIYTPQQPTAVLYYNNTLTFRGPPDQVYHVKIQAYHEEIEFTDTGSLNADYLFRYLAYGASLDIFSDFGETDKWNEIYPIFRRYRSLVYARTNCQYQNQRAGPDF